MLPDTGAKSYQLSLRPSLLVTILPNQHSVHQRINRNYPFGRLMRSIYHTTPWREIPIGQDNVVQVLANCVINDSSRQVDMTTGNHELPVAHDQGSVIDVVWIRTCTLRLFYDRKLLSSQFVGGGRRHFCKSASLTVRTYEIVKDKNVGVHLFSYDVCQLLASAFARGDKPMRN